MWLPLGPRSPGSHYAPPIHLRESLTASEISAIGLSNEVALTPQRRVPKPLTNRLLPTVLPQQQPRDAITPGIWLGCNKAMILSQYMCTTFILLKQPLLDRIVLASIAQGNGQESSGNDQGSGHKGQERGSKIGTKIDS
jgi:hypothetical protein